jgi:hypothetical protein
MAKVLFEKPGFLDVSVGSETRLAKNRVSSARNPVGEKPGFDGWEKTGFRPLGKNRVSS